MAEEVATHENDTTITEVSAEDVKQIYLSLYHAHIPKLEDASFVHDNQDTDSVAPAEKSEQLEQYTEVLEIE